MRRYWSIFKISFQQEFAYRLNFIMWRVRNVMQIFLVFFLWDTIFSNPGVSVFGYDRAKILTYVFGLVIVRPIVLSMRSIDVAGEISRGDVSNYLLKPLSYFKYWFTRDLSSKALNLLFAAFETTILFLIFKPQFFLQVSPIYLMLFLISLASAVILYFLLVFIFSEPVFWFPHIGWGFLFILITFADLLGGGTFPIDIFPQSVQNILYLTPFPYLLFIPIEIYLGKFSVFASLKFITIGMVWILLLYFINRKLWNSGLKSYRSEGR